MQYSISNWIYATEDLEKSLQRLARYKYDAVELEGEPDKEKYESISDPYLALEGGVSENIFDQYTEDSIMGLKYLNVLPTETRTSYIALLILEKGV